MTTKSEAQRIDLAGLAVPAGWEPVARMCEAIAEQPDRLIDRILDGVREGTSLFAAPPAPVPGEVRLWVADNLRMFLLGIAERRGPTPEELTARRESGYRRAEQGMPLDALLQGLVLGYRMTWDELVARTRAGDAGTRDMLLSAAGTTWQWGHEVTEAVGTAYREHALRRQALDMTRHVRLIETIRGGDRSSEQAADLVREAGFDPDGPFRVACAAGAGSLALHGRGRLHRGPRGAYLIVEVDQTTILLGQGVSEADARAAMRDALRDVPVGIGLQRSGVSGARLSLGDAERALAVASIRGEASAYEDSWLVATLLPARERLEELLRPGYDAIDWHPDLAETVRAFAESGLSQSAAGRRLQIHPNTVAYRLMRWTELTGWDPRTGDGLQKSLAALELRGHSRAKA